MSAAAYRSKSAEDELARRAVEAASKPPMDGAERPIVPLSRTMDEWLEATEVELLDGPLVFGDDDEEFLP